MSAGNVFGTLLKQRLPVIALAGIHPISSSLVERFGPLSLWSTPGDSIHQLGCFPHLHAMVLQQHAFHDFELNTYGTRISMILVIYAVALIILSGVCIEARSTLATD